MKPLTADQVRRISEFIAGIAQLEASTGVSLCLYGPDGIEVDGDDAGQLTRQDGSLKYDGTSR